MMAATDVKQIRLNPQALELLNSVEGSITGRNSQFDRKNSQKDIVGHYNLAGDLMNPLDDSTNRPRTRIDKADQRRCSSTFSSYYLNKQAKDLASITSIEDRQFGSIDEERDIFAADPDVGLTIADKRSKAGTMATRGLFSFKSELHSLIGNL